MNVRLGLARRDDAAEIADMSRIMIEHGLPWTWDERRVRRCIGHRESAVLVARDRRRLAGFAIMEYLDVDAHLNLLAVRPGYRLHGVGRQLLDWLESSARTAGIFLVRLEVRAGNDAAVRFYRRLGYREAGKRKGYYSGREDALIMTHDLSVQSTSNVWDWPRAD
ncbi:MAG: ribosomal protein S18-alanine N-acetyltransferase [Gammaproteobacteria bacterium]|nr:ribosomal protein S18-alanine N-acetyltransferase [Gammaproteobacteria bacterium]